MNVLINAPLKEERKAIQTALIDTGFCQQIDCSFLGSHHTVYTDIIRNADLVVVVYSDRRFNLAAPEIIKAASKLRIPVLEGYATKLLRMLHKSDEER